MPRWTYENKITLGNIIQAVVLVLGGIAVWYGLVDKVNASARDIMELQRDIAPFESLNTRLTVVESRAETADKRLSEVVESVDNLVNAINMDRVASGRNDAEIRKDVGYLRDWVAEQKRLDGSQ